MIDSTVKLDQQRSLLAVLSNMENIEDTNEPTGDDVEAKEVDSETGDGKEETAEKEDLVVKKENKIEQRPFLTQSELLIKMKSGEEEEVKRCQIMIAAIASTVRFVLRKKSLSSGRIVCCLLANGVAIYCNRSTILILILTLSPQSYDPQIPILTPLLFLVARGCRHDKYQTRGPSLDPDQEEELKFSPVLSRCPR